jgi:hypothetical protein
MTSNKLSIELIKYALPIEIVDYFDLKKLKEAFGYLSRWASRLLCLLHDRWRN